MPAAALPPPAFFAENDFLPGLLELSLTGVVCYTPLTDASGAVVDLAFAYLNPAAQRLLALPAQPATTYAQQFPASLSNGVFARHLTALQTPEPQHFNLSYQANGHARHYQAAARRVGGGLLVSLAEASDHNHSGPAAEQALRASQAREQQAQAEAALQKAQLHNILGQAPAMICIFDGPQHTFQFVNGPYQALVGQRPLVGKPIAEAMPELAGQPIFGLLDNVYHTGETFFAHEMLVQLDHANAGAQELEKRYYNFSYQARRDLAGAIDGILVFAYEVTTQVRARQQVEDNARQLAGLNRQLDESNEELAATNEELQAANEEFLTNNTALTTTQLALQVLNEELEARVSARSRDVQAALREAEQQREQLRTQQRLLRQILGQVPAAIATLAGPEHRYSFLNDNYESLTGGRTQLTKTVAECLPEIAQQGFVLLLDQVYATGQPYAGTEAPVQLPELASGQLRLHYLDFVYQPIFDGLGQVQGILVFIVDATEKVLARQQATALQAEVLAAAQRQAQQREDLYQVFEQTPAVIGLLRGPEHRIDYCNPAFQELFAGRPMLGLTIAEAQPEAVAQGFIDLLDRVYRTGETYFGNELPMTIALAGQPADQRFFNFTYQAYRENEVIAGISVFTYDVTGQVLARREADQQRELLHTLFMDAPAPIAILDGPDFVYQLVNPAYQQIFPGRALAGRAVAEALPELADTAIPGLLRHVYTSGEAFVAQELPLHVLRHDDGELEEIFVTFTYQPRYNATDQIDGILVFAYEVTEQVRARRVVEDSRQRTQALADELAATNERLRRTNADLDTFVYTASHDLKSPIANLEGLFTALREQLPPEASRAPLVPRLLGMMDGAVARFQETLAHLTDVSKLQQVGGAPAEAVDLAALVHAVRLDLAAELASTGGTLTVAVADCPTVQFAPKNLRSIIYNLLSNALKYHAPGRPPVVALRCHRAAGQLLLEVQDNGLGLDASQQAKLFTMFRRLHTHVAGSGVGLYMVKRIVENAGGTITVQSQPGVGSTFTVALPG